MQQFGLQLLIRQDNILAGDKEIESLRLAMLASGQRSPEDLFPEYFAEEPKPGVVLDEDAPEDALAMDGVDYDYSGVQWQGPEDISADEIALLEEFFGGDDGPSPVMVESDDPRGWM